MDSSSSVWTAVEGDFNQPAWDSTDCTNKALASWVGIGGFNAPDAFLQAGTSAEPRDVDAAWYEIFNSSGETSGSVPIPMTIHAGDHIHEHVSYNRSTHEADFWVHDETTDTGQAVLVPNLAPSDYWDGRSAEWIDERPSVNNVPLHLEDYGTNNWNSLQAKNTSSQWVEPGTYPNNYVIVMTDSANYVLSGAGSFGTSSFTDTWERCS